MSRGTWGVWAQDKNAAHLWVILDSVDAKRRVWIISPRDDLRIPHQRIAGRRTQRCSTSPPWAPAFPLQWRRGARPERCPITSSTSLPSSPTTAAAAPSGFSSRAGPPPAPSSRPARDRAIEFGKYKGQMLGTLPPSYLRWVTAELDYGDTAPWAGLARDVLDDPVYVDRVEWEHAHRFLRGDSNYDYAYDDGGDGPLQEMAERFGWDLSDEEGWGRLDFRLLGSSYGGRIPRKSARKQRSSRSDPAGSARTDSGSVSDGPRRKRDERRERMRLRREDEVRTAKLGMLGVNAGVPEAPRKGQIKTAKKEILGLGRRNLSDDAGTGGQGGSPFPGRQAFLDKVRKLKDDN